MKARKDRVSGRKRVQAHHAEKKAARRTIPMD
jgi:hypothetical protein